MMNLDVLIPVGPGHEELSRQAISSVRIARENPGPFGAVHLFTRYDLDGAMGRSAVRNELVHAARSDWLFFLDADDLMAPDACIQVRKHLKGRDAVFGLLVDDDSGQFRPRLGQPEHIKSLNQLRRLDPYLSLNMGHFVRREVARKLPFAEDMDAGEDFDYYVRLFKSYKAVKVPKVFYLCRRGMHSTGPRSAHGGDWRQAVTGILNRA